MHRALPFLLVACAATPPKDLDGLPADLAMVRLVEGPPSPLVAATAPSPEPDLAVLPVEGETEEIASETRASIAPPRSGRLESGLFNPMPGGVFAGYRADTGLDLAGIRRPVHAIAAGTLDYSETGHTRWTGPRDTDGAVRLALDEPLPHGDRRITHVWYAHLSELRFQQREGAPERIHVEGGELLGVSGIANGSPHLHLGLLLDGDVEQRWGGYLLEDEVRAVLGGRRTGDRLPE
jgi:murein DD-endopeptidase MepM/ murein hydrolase activator NlpD